MKPPSPIHLLALLTILLVLGCSISDSTSPDADPSCTIVLSPRPDSLNAGWLITGSDNYHQQGAGEKSISLTPGEYVVAWDSIPGWATPSPASVTLAPETSELVHGIYIPVGVGDLWVIFTVVSPDIGPEFDVRVDNTLLNTDVLLFIDTALVDTVRAASTLDIVVTEGARQIDFVPLSDSLRAFSYSLDVWGNMIWKLIIFNPGGPEPIDQ